MVKLRPELTREHVLALWLGPHADVIREAVGVTEYVVALAREQRGPQQWDAVVTLRCESDAAMRAIFEEPAIAAALHRTREPFIQSVDAFIAEEHMVIDSRGRET